jgi:hypothetical protein
MPGFFHRILRQLQLEVVPDKRFREPRQLQLAQAQGKPIKQQGQLQLEIMPEHSHKELIALQLEIIQDKLIFQQGLSCLMLQEAILVRRRLMPGSTLIRCELQPLPQMDYIIIQVPMKLRMGR